MHADDDTLQTSAKVPMLKLFDSTTASPTPVSGIGNKVARPDDSETKVVIATVALPARGKSYLINKLKRYLTWLEYSVRVFRSDDSLRLRTNRRTTTPVGDTEITEYLSRSSTETILLQDEFTDDSLERLIQWLKNGGNVGFYDAMNITQSLRQKIENRVSKEEGITLIFLECLCDDPILIARNVAAKISSGDYPYRAMTREEAQADILRRMTVYESVYETISEPHLSYLKIINVGKQVAMNRIHGHLLTRIAFFIMNMHLKPRNILLARHGESQHNVEGKIGGDSSLSHRGMVYADALADSIPDNIGGVQLVVWTSTLRRSVQTAEYMPYPKLTWKALDELDAGVCDGMTYEEMELAYPAQVADRDEDKYNYRYRGGESYRDVVRRLEPVIVELERQQNVLIIGHQAVLRCLYAYFLDVPPADLPYVKIPLHTVIRLRPHVHGAVEDRYPLPISAVDTHRPKPQGRGRNALDIATASGVETRPGNALQSRLRAPPPDPRPPASTVSHVQPTNEDLPRREGNSVFPSSRVTVGLSATVGGGTTNAEDVITAQHIQKRGNNFVRLASTAAKLFYSTVCLLCFSTVHEAFFRELSLTWDHVQRDPAGDISSAQEWETFLSGQRRQWGIMKYLWGIPLAGSPALLQIFSSASSSITQTLGIVSFLCALISLSFGMIFQSRFDHLDRSGLGHRWIQDVAKIPPSSWKFPPLLLAPPYAWLAWAIVSLISLILSYEWAPLAAAQSNSSTSISTSTNGSRGRAAILLPPLLVTLILIIGLGHIYIVATLFLRFGSGRRAAM